MRTFKFALDEVSQGVLIIKSPCKNHDFLYLPFRVILIYNMSYVISA